LKEFLPYVQNAGAIAFVVLGLVTAVTWARRRDHALGFLALAIVLLSLVSLLGRIPAGYAPPLLPQISLLVFMGSGYALLRFRGSLIPLPARWHAIAVVAMLGASIGFLGAQALVAAHAAPVSLATVAVFALVLVWSATIVEPIVRFWLVARDLPPVQAWRLRSLSFGFGGLVAILVFAIAGSAFAPSFLPPTKPGLPFASYAVRSTGPVGTRSRSPIGVDVMGSLCRSDDGDGMRDPPTMQPCACP